MKACRLQVIPGIGLVNKEHLFLCFPDIEKQNVKHIFGHNAKKEIEKHIKTKLLMGSVFAEDS